MLQALVDEGVACERIRRCVDESPELVTRDLFGLCVVAVPDLKVLELTELAVVECVLHFTECGKGVFNVLLAVLLVLPHVRHDPVVRI